MKKAVSILFLTFIMLGMLVTPVLADKPSGFDSTGTATGYLNDNGFNQYGYNYTARIFSGTYLSWCEQQGLTDTACYSWLDPYTNDKLVMKWNSEWDRGNAEGWTNPPYAAWEDNEENGMVAGGSGAVWHYKIVWVGPCGADYTPLENGGYCLWGQFEVIMDQGTQSAVHTWFAHGMPTGYGVYP